MSATRTAAATGAPTTSATSPTTPATTGSERYGGYGQGNTGDGEKRPTFRFH